MSDENKPKEPEVFTPGAYEVEREFKMYKDYLRHMPIEDMAVKYDMSVDNIYKIARRNDWKKKRLKAKEKAYRQLDIKYKEQIVDIMEFVQRDLMKLIQKCTKENREMTMPERGYTLSLYEKLVKESRLNEGKPTEITDGNQVIRHEVVLPPGVEHFGVIPPAANVIQVSASQAPSESETPEDKVGLDDDDET